MTTPEGQRHLDPNGSSTHATSTVLALDGWGPIIVEPPSNGANGSEPDTEIKPVSQIEVPEPQPARLQRMVGGWRQTAQMEIDSRLIRVAAPVLAMALAIVAGIKLGSLYQWPSEPSLTPSPPGGVEVLRRRVALAIDPSLTPVEPEHRGLLDWIR